MNSNELREEDEVFEDRVRYILRLGLNPLLDKVMVDEKLKRELYNTLAAAIKSEHEYYAVEELKSKILSKYGRNQE